MLIEQIYEKDIENKFIDLYTRNASIYLPKNLSFFHSYQLGVRTTLLPLALAGGNANISLSTALILSILDDNDQEFEMNITNNISIENEKCSRDSLPEIIDQLYRFSSNYFV